MTDTVKGEADKAPMSCSRHQVTNSYQESIWTSYAMLMTIGSFPWIDWSLAPTENATTWQLGLADLSFRGVLIA